MALFGLFGVFVIIGGLSLWILLKAATKQFQAEWEGIETTAPRVLLNQTTTIFKTVITAAVVVELWPGLSSWAYDAWYWILANLV